MAGVHVCAVCEHTFNEADRKPLVLLCGHTYCQQCLHDVVSGSSPACPSCRKEIVSPVNELPVNFIAIPSSSGKATSESLASTKMFCISHQNELDFLCSKCQVLICKRCLVQAHAEHKFTLAEDMFADQKTLSDLKSQINANLLQVKASICNLQQLESSGFIIDEVKSNIPQLKRALLKQESTLCDLLKVLEEISLESSLEQKNLVLKMLKDQNQMHLEEGQVNKALEPFQDQVVQCQICRLPNGNKMKLTDTERYMRDGLPWIIISNELAEKALCTMKETGHQTPKATVISTDESPILCLPELLQYLAASSTTMELQLMDKAVKNPYKRDWLPLKAGGNESTDFNHRYRLNSLTTSLVSFQTLAAALTTVDYITDSMEDTVLILVNPETRTYDVCVLAFGKIVKSNTGSWPLPLEVHVIGMNFANYEWVKCILPSLYYIAQPHMDECRVYLPRESVSYEVYTTELLPMFAELGKKFSTQHHLFVSAPDSLKPECRQATEAYKIALEFRDF